MEKTWSSFLFAQMRKDILCLGIRSIHCKSWMNSNYYDNMSFATFSMKYTRFSVEWVLKTQMLPLALNTAHDPYWAAQPWGDHLISKTQIPHSSDGGSNSYLTRKLWKLNEIKYMGQNIRQIYTWQSFSAFLQTVSARLKYQL